MTIKNFRVKYSLQTLQTRSNPLFNKIRASLISGGVKRFITETSDFKNNRVAFKATMDEEGQNLTYNDKLGTYEDNFVTLVLEFDAQGRFIKLGEALINLADILNCNRLGQSIGYKVQKCYDRNAKLTVAVQLTEDKYNRQTIFQLERQQGVNHCRSHCQLPQMKRRMRSNYQLNKYNITECSVVTDHQNEKEEEYQLISDKRTSYHNQIDKYTTGKTEILNKESYYQLKNMQDDLVNCRTQLKITQHQLAHLEQKYQQLEEDNQNLKNQLRDGQSQNYQIASHCEELKKQLINMEQGRDNQKEQLNNQINKYLKLYQESEQERNKIFAQIDQVALTEKQKNKELDKKINQERVKIKQFQKSQLALKKKIQEYMNQIAVYDKALKCQKNQREKLENQINQLTKSIELLNQQKSVIINEKNSFQNEKQQLQNQLQMGRFSIKQLERQLIQLRKVNQQKGEMITRYEAEIKFSSQAIRQQRSEYNKRMAQIGYKTQRDQKNVQVYLEQLQIKTINEYSKNNQISQLRKQVNKFKKLLSIEKDRAADIQKSNIQLISQIESLKVKINLQSNKNIDLLKERTQLQSQIKRLRQDYIDLQNTQQNPQLTEQERDLLIAECYQERDLYWNETIQNIDNDTKTFIEKSKREKDNLQFKIQKLESAITDNQEQISNYITKIKTSQVNEQKLKKIIKQSQNKIIILQKEIAELNQQKSKILISNQNLSKKNQLIDQLELNISVIQKKLSAKNIELNSIKADFERQKSVRQKIRLQVKQIISAVNNYMNKSQKHKIFFQELKCQQIDAQFMIMFNSSLKLFSEKHNKTKLKLQQLQELKSQLQSKDKEVSKLNKSLRNQRRYSHGQSLDQSCSQIKSQTVSTKYILPIHNFRAPIPQPLPTKEDQQTKNILRKQIEQLKSKFRKQSAKVSELERQVERLNRLNDQNMSDTNRLNQEVQKKSEQAQECRQKLKIKEKQLQTAKDQCRQLSGEIYQLKNQVEQCNRMIKMEKNQSQMLKRTAPAVNRSFGSYVFNKTERQDQNLFKMLDLEKRYRNVQDQLDKLKKEKEEQKSSFSNHGKTVKMFQIKLKEKDHSIAELKKQMEEERQRADQLKQMNSLKMRKIKEEHDQEIQSKLKVQKEMQKIIEDGEQKYRQIQKKLKITQDNLKSVTIQLTVLTEKDQKNKKIFQTEWELKIKSMQSDYEGQISAWKKQLDQNKTIQQSHRDIERKKDRQIHQLKIQVQKREKIIIDLSEKLEHYGVRLKNMEEDENKYQQTIDCLQKKIKIGDSIDESIKKISQRERDAQRDTSQIKSNFSLKTFTFR